MPKKSETRKSLEALLESELTEEELQRISFFQKVATYAFSDDPGGPILTEKNLLIPLPNRCTNVAVLDVYGIATTGSNGKSVFRLTQFICPGEDLIFLPPINFVATPLSSTPCFPTATRTLVNNNADVEIQVSMWDASGTPVPGVSFDWHCHVVRATIIL
jgi:hypothetical protein